jgi:transposase
VEPLLPLTPRPWYGGRRRTIPDRNCFAAIVYMVRTSTPWRLLPAQELGCGSPATCWRRLTEWAKAGLFNQLHLEVLDRLGVDGELEWSRASVDTMSVRARHGGSCWRKSRRSWQTRLQAPPGLQRQWLPLTVAVTAANVNDSTMFEALMDDVPAVRTPSGRRRCRPGAVHADKGYDARHCRAYLRRRGINARIARRGIESSKRLGRYRWRVERALSWLSCFRRLQVRWDRDSGRFFAFVLLACALVCGNRLWSPGHAGGVAVVGGSYSH